MRKEYILISHCNISNLQLCFDLLSHFNKPAFQIAEEIQSILNSIRINDTNKKDDVIIFINLQTQDKDGNFIEEKLIDALIFLRCKYKIPNPIKCFGIEELAEILMNHPNYLILNSPGTAYSKNNEIENILPEKLTPRSFDRLKKFLMTAVDLEKFRHFYGNLWGIKCLWDVQELIDGKLNRPYPQGVEEIESSPMFAILAFLYFDQNYSKGFPNIASKKRIEDSLESIHKLNPPPNIIFVDDLAHLGWETALSNMIFDNSLDQKKINSHFKIIAPKAVGDISVGKLSRELKGHIYSFARTGLTDLIIMDLRLFNEEGKMKDVYRLSGIQLFKAIRRQYKSIPILIVTSSNKIDTFIYLYNLENLKPPDGFWIKEGIDFHVSENDKLDSYLKLLTQIIYLINTRRKNKFVKAFKLESFENISQKEEALKIINNGLAGIQKDYSNINFKNDLLELFNQNYCLIDTNIFVENKLRFVFRYYQSILLLAELRKSINKKVSIHINVLNEIIKFGMDETKDEILSDISRNIFKRMREFYENNILELIIPSSFFESNSELLKKSMLSDPFADNVLFETCKFIVENNRTLLFISNDKADPKLIRENDKGSTIYQLNQYFVEFPERAHFCKMMDGDAFIRSISSALS